MENDIVKRIDGERGEVEKRRSVWHKTRERVKECEKNREMH
jgi:hypothetical protein